MLVRLLVLFCVTLLSGCGDDPRKASIETLYIMSSGGFTAAYLKLSSVFEKETGIKLVTSFGASSGGAPDSIPERLHRGEQADVVILSKNGLNRLIATKYVDPDSSVDLARSSIGMAVREGAALKDIKTVESFVKTLQQAESIGYSASASGTYLSTILFPNLGLWEDIQSKSHRIVSERVGTVVARGDVEIGFQQVSELLPIAGITYVGPIPEELQKITIFSTAITTTGNAVTAQRLIDFLSSRSAVKIIEDTGLDAITAE